MPGVARAARRGPAIGIGSLLILGEPPMERVVNLSEAA